MAKTSHSAINFNEVCFHNKLTEIEVNIAEMCNAIAKFNYSHKKVVGASFLSPCLSTIEGFCLSTHAILIAAS